MRLRHGSASHVGLVRRQNEDSYVAESGLYAVCDGMGGARAGEVASEMACRVLLALDRTVDPHEGLARAVLEGNRSIRERSRQDSSKQGMGTTLTAALVRDTTMTLAHVGDSRAYRLRDGVLEQLTEDHSLVGEMVRRGQITPAQAAVHPHRSIITRALGPEDAVHADIFDVELHPGDRFLFCSDGLSGMVPDAEIGRLLGEDADPRTLAEALVRAALAGGGEDNVTAVVVAVLDDDEDDVPPAEAGDAVAEADDAALGPTERGPQAPAGADGAVGLPAAPVRDGPLARGRRRIVLAAAGVLLVLAVGLGGFAVWNTTVYFVGTKDGNVALYKGMPYRVLGVTLYEPVEVSATRYETLDDYLKTRIDTHELVTKEEGQRFIRGLASGE